jgi:hypothetical protein
LWSLIVSVAFLRFLSAHASNSSLKCRDDYQTPVFSLFSELQSDQFAFSSPQFVASELSQSLLDF